MEQRQQSNLLSLFGDADEGGEGRRQGGCDDDSAAGGEGGGAAPRNLVAPPDGLGLKSIYIMCYHLPVILSHDPGMSAWSACWLEFGVSHIQVGAPRRVVDAQDHVGGDRVQCAGVAPCGPRRAGGICNLIGGMDCIPVFFFNDIDNGGGGGMGGRRAGGERSNFVDLMYLGFCKQVLWPSFHNVDLLDLAMNGWGQRQRDTNRSDPVRACQLAAEEARERKLSMSAAGAAAEWGGTMPTSPRHGEGRGLQRPELKSDWDQRRLNSWWNTYVRV